MKLEISKLIEKNVEQLQVQEVQKLIEVPSMQEMGDFSMPCFSLAKVLRKSPTKIAEGIKKAIEPEINKAGIARTEVVNGYLNFFMDRDSYIQSILKCALDENYGAGTEGIGKTVCMDYSSPNIAKNFHVGHLRTTIIGNSLYKIYEKLGYKVIRINHLGDWGTQFGKLIVAYQRWSSKEKVEIDGIKELLRIYVKFNHEAELNPTLDDEARSWFAKMEHGNQEALEIWKWFKDISMIEFERVYQSLGVEFDYYLGESFYMDKVPALVQELKDKNLLEESQGANIINLDNYDMPPCLITKKDGSSIYHSRDIAALLYRKKEYDFDKCLYVTGLEQSLHFAQVFKSVELMGYEWASGLVHVPYGLVSLKGEKLSTRIGNIVYAEDILKEAVSRAAEMIEQKNPELPNKENVAAMVGIGAIMFHDLFNQRIKNMDFSWNDVLNFEGSTGPYVQYTYARAKSILRNAGDSIEWDNVDTKILTNEASYSLLKVIATYPEVVKEAAERYEPSVIARFTISLATAFNKFYHDCRILDEEQKIKKARLVLVDITQKMIKDSLDLLGIQCPEEM